MTAWLLTWLWQGLALAARCGGRAAVRARLNAATRHLVWCGALAALAWLGWTPSITPYGESRPRCQAPRDRRPILHLRRRPTSSSASSSASGRRSRSSICCACCQAFTRCTRCATAAVRFRRPIEAQLPLWLEAKERGRRTELMICDAVPGATVLGLPAPMYCDSVIARRGADRSTSSIK